MPNTTAEPLTELTAFQRDAVAVLSSLERPIGLEIRSALSEVYGEEIEHGRLYPNLDKLADRGLVDKSEKDGRSNLYVLTPEGRRAMLSDLAWREYAAGFYQPSLSDVEESLEQERFDAPKVSLETCLERVVDAGLAVPTCGAERSRGRGDCARPVGAIGERCPTHRDGDEGEGVEA